MDMKITEDERKFLLIGNILSFLIRYRDSDMQDAELAEKILEIVERGVVFEK
jgi:hypothetical protein